MPKKSVTANNDEYDAVLVHRPYDGHRTLKIEAEGLQKITVANSDNVRLGQWVLAGGILQSYQHSYRRYHFSQRAHINIIDEQSAIESFLQTDAAVNPGNSGGALGMVANLLGSIPPSHRVAVHLKATASPYRPIS